MVLRKGNIKPPKLSCERGSVLRQLLAVLQEDQKVVPGFLKRDTAGPPPRVAALLRAALESPLSL